MSLTPPGSCGIQAEIVIIVMLFVNQRLWLKFPSAGWRTLGVTIRYRGGGGAGVFAWPFLFISQGSLKSVFSPQDRLEIFISIFILYLFQPPLWTKYLVPEYSFIIHSNRGPLIRLSFHKNVGWQSGC